MNKLPYFIRKGFVSSFCGSVFIPNGRDTYGSDFILHIIGIVGISPSYLHYDINLPVGALLYSPST